jgi:conjugal transfer/type IV secretion protein DotA/TraY
MTGIITSFSNMTAQNGDPILTAQSLGMTVIDGAEAALVAVATFKVGSTSANTATKNASKIPIVGGAFGAVAGAVTSAAKALGNVTWDMALIITIPLLILGAGLAYLLPALPFILFTRGVLAWVFGIFESLFASPIWGIFHAQPDGEGFLHESVRTGYLRILELFIRPVLMIIGFFIFFQMYEALSFLILTGFGAMVSGVTAGSMSGIVAIISFLCVLDFLMISSIWTLGKLCIIDLPSLVLTWAGGHGASQGTPETMGTPGRHQGVDALIGGAATRELLRGKNQTQVKPEITGKEKP